MIRAKKLLIIEDDEILLRVLVDKFTNRQVEVLSAKNGERGLELALMEHPDMILLDIVMPKMDGLTVLKRLKKDNWGKNVPVIILTNLSDADTVDMAMKLGVYDYLVKIDWTLEDVFAKVENKLGKILPCPC